MEATEKPEPGADTHYWREEGTSGNNKREDGREAGRHDQYKGLTFQNASASNNLVPLIGNKTFRLLTHKKNNQNICKTKTL